MTRLDEMADTARLEALQRAWRIATGGHKRAAWKRLQEEINAQMRRAVDAKRRAA